MTSNPEFSVKRQPVLHMPFLFLMILTFGINNGALSEPSVSIKKETGDLKYLAVKDAELEFNVYFEDGLFEIAKKSVPHLQKIYTEISHLSGILPDHVEWSDVAFVSSNQYIPPRNNEKVRWPITVDQQKNFDSDVLEILYDFIAHEQTHALQRVSDCKLPRWFSEGQANWVSFHVAKNRSKQHQQTMLMDLATGAQNESNEGEGGVKVNLKNWGAMIVKREAIYRQTNKAEQTKMNADPNYTPVGPYTLKAGDVISDESMSASRYHLSWKIFNFIESKTSKANTSNIISSYLKDESCDTEHIIKILQQKYGIDINAFFQQ